MMDTGCRGNRITDFSKRPSGKKHFLMNTRIAAAMTQNTEYVPKKDTDDVNEDEDVNANCPPSEDDDKPAKKGKKRKHPSCQSNEEEEPKLKKKSLPVKEGERKLTKKRDHHVKHQRPVCHKKNANLRHHLQMHTRRGQITPDQAGTFLSVAINNSRCHGL